MKLYPAQYLLEVGTKLFTACGAPEEEAAIVASELVEASLMGLDSHGIVRYSQYVDDVFNGQTKPGAPLRVIKESPTTAVVDCGFNFGPVSAARMADIACEKGSRSNMAYVISRNCAHIGRLGSYVQRIAERGMFGFATCNSSKHGHWVVPWGGREGRLATNPLAYAAPTRGIPVVLDMSTSMISEGKVRVLMHQGKPAPEGCIQDASGDPTIDPAVFYGPPRGTIRPFGSELGYKGFGLALLVEIMSGIMAGEAASEEHPYVNGLAIMAINPEAFCGAAQFRDLMDDLCAYITSSPSAPGCKEVAMPGAYDFRIRRERLADGIPVDPSTWQSILDSVHRVGASITDLPLRPQDP